MTDFALTTASASHRDQSRSRTTNPFRSSNLRPGVIPYLFPENTSVSTLLERFGELGRAAEIRGPHGTGKSTLATTLAEAWRKRGFDILKCTLRQGDRALPLSRPDWIQRRGPKLVLLIDGAEQLRPWMRWKWVTLCRRSGCGLLMTTHRSLGVATLWETDASVASARRVIAEILSQEQCHGDQLDNTSSGCAVFSDHEIGELLRQHHHNLREVLFSLYDLWQQRNVTSK